MNLEQLQAMSDDELNELSAVKVMGKVYQNGKMFGKKEGTLGHRFIAPWNPANDMNDAMDIVIHLRKQGIVINLETYPSEFAATSTTNGIGIIYDDKPARAITIASILAKGE